MDNQLADLMRAMQSGSGTGMGGMNTLNRAPQDPRLGALQQYMQMQGGGQMPPQLPQQQMGPRGQVRPQSGYDVEAQTNDAYDATPPGQQALSDRTYGREPAPPDHNADFEAAGAPGGMTDEQMLEQVHGQMNAPQSIDDLDPKEHDLEYLRSLPPRAQRAYIDSINESDERPGEGPATDSDIDAAFGRGASERSMGGQEPYDRGFRKENDTDSGPYPDRRRRRNEPPSRRFQNLDD